MSRSLAELCLSQRSDEFLRDRQRRSGPGVAFKGFPPSTLSSGPSSLDITPGAGEKPTSDAPPTARAVTSHAQSSPPRPSPVHAAPCWDVTGDPDGTTFSMKRFRLNAEPSVGRAGAGAD